MGVFLIVVGLCYTALILFFGHFKTNSYRVKVTFANAKGIVRQSVVRMQGVTIGEVESVDLSKTTPPRPVVLIAINKEYDIPTDSQCRIASGILITNPQLEITPGTQTASLAKDNTAEITGVESGGLLETLSPELTDTLKTFNKTFSKLNVRFDQSFVKIDKILDQTQGLLKTSTETITTAKSLIGDPRIRNQLFATLSNFAEVSNETRLAAKQIRVQFNNVLASGAGTLDELKESMLNLFDRLDTTLDDANTVVKKITEQVTDPRLQQSVQETVELARTTLARFNQIASDLHQFVGDSQLQGDMKQIVTNLRNATAEGEAALSKVNKFIGNVTDGAKTFKPSLPKVDLLANLSERVDPERFRLDLEARIALGERSLINAGIWDLGGESRLILQGGTLFNDSLTARYGLFASKLGAGLDWKLSQNTQIRADLYDTVRPRLDLRTLFRVNKNASIWLGADGLGRNPTPRFGIQMNY